MKSPSSFIAITSEGGLLPADFLHELPDPKTTIEGVTPVAYHLAEGERLNEQINRSWNRLKGCWENFKKAVAEKTLSDPTTTDTRERWLFPLFQELGFGRLTVAKPIEVDGHSYPVSHCWNQVPIHLVGSHADLDHRTPGAIGASKASPHSLVQSALNASDAHLWGIVSNGFNLRLLRDNIALTRLAFVEFDLQAMFDGDLYSEFFVLWLVCHQSRFEGETTDQYWLERWKKSAEGKTLRALDDLYPGVKKAIAVLGAGLVSNRANGVLLEKLRTGRLSTQEFYKQVLRVIYRLLFLLVAEDRDLLHLVDDTEAGIKGRRRYREFYSITRLRALTLYRAGTPHPDLWQVFQLVTAKLGSDTGCPDLALPPLGSYLWTEAQSTPDLLDSFISNRHFLEAVHALAFVQDNNVRRAVDYKNLGSEELGSVYQGLLEMHPRINADAGSFELDTAAGNERKTSGSYYTPDSLVQCLLDSALEPVIAERLAKAKTPKEKETALLSLKVCDMAAGSGHFIIRAGHRIARHLARVRSGEEEPSPTIYRTALRDVIGHCLYGVDINPMAVELCKVTLWLEALEPGKPLSFLDHHIRCGNSLLGATPELIKGGIPDEAYEVIEGDDKEACAALKKKNKRENPKLGEWFIADEAAIRDRLYQASAQIDKITDSRPEDIHRKEAAFRAAQSNYDFQKAKDLADLWCAAFVIKKHFPESTVSNSAISNPQAAISTGRVETQSGLFCVTEETAKAKRTKAPSRAGSEHPIGITTQHLRDFVEGGALPDGLLAEAKRLADQYQFLHFHLAFPEVFAQGGFDVSLGNPPWERVKLQEKEWFSANGRPDIANAPSATARGRLIAALSTEDPDLREKYLNSLRLSEGESHIMRNSGNYPLCGRGDINVYTIFAERMRNLLRKKGCFGAVLPTGVVTDETTQFFFQDVVEKMSLISVFDFENREGFFPAVDSRMKFCLFTCGSVSGDTTKASDFVFFAHALRDLRDPQRRYSLSREDMQTLNPNTLTCPVFRARADAELSLEVHRRIPIFRRETAAQVLSPWDCDLGRGFRQGEDEETLKRLGFDRNKLLFTCEEVQGESGFVPLVEGKTFDIYDHRAASIVLSKSAVFRPRQPVETPVELHRDPSFTATPYFWAQADVARAKFPWAWFVAHKKVTSATNERTMVATILGSCAVNDTVHVFTPGLKTPTNVLPLLSANLCSFALDYFGRQKLGGNAYSMFVAKQLPLIPPGTYGLPSTWAGGKGTLRDWLLPRVLELTYTAWDLEAFAKDCGWSGPPFRWDEGRRCLLRCELDAAFFHLYLGPETEWIKQPDALTKAFPTPRHAVDYILDTFPIVKRKDEAKFKGDYRTKRVILEIYDALAESMQTGKAYQTRLAPIPASFRSAHIPKLPKDKRIALDSAEKFLLSFIYGFLHQTHEEASFDLLDSVFHLLRQRDRHVAEFITALGDAATEWVSSFNDKIPNKEFVPFLKRLEADGWIIADRETGKMGITEKFPAVPFDAWRNYDISATLQVLAQQPEIVKLVLEQPDTPLASREFLLQKAG
jgi:hypothetical protein